MRKSLAARAAAPIAPEAPQQTSEPSSSGSNAQPDVVYGKEVMFSGLKGKALESGKYWPTKQEVFDVIPAHCFKRDSAKSMLYAALSLGMTAACVYAGTLLPMTWAWTPAWILYSAVTGAAAPSFNVHAALRFAMVSVGALRFRRL